MEPEAKDSKLEKLRRKAYEKEIIDDIHDSAKENFEPLNKLFDRPAGSAHADVPVHHSKFSPESHEHASVGDAVLAGVVLSYMGVEVGRAAAHGVHNLKDKTHDLIERYRHAGD